MSAEDLSPAARQTLLMVARQAIERTLAGGTLAEDDWGPELRQPRGAFVTLRHRSSGDLRGCVGHVEPDQPLVEAVVRAAVAAARTDRRFKPVALAELPELAVEISALSALNPVRPEEVEVGLHGLVVSWAGRSGLLLPQVAVSHAWDRDAFLDFVCWKAGLAAGTWKRPGCAILAFTATVFGED